MPEHASPLLWLAPPETHGRGLPLVHSLGWTVLAVGIFGLAAGLIYFGLSSPLVKAAAATIAVGAGAIALSRAGQLDRAGLLLIGGSFTIVALGTFHQGHVLSPSNMGFFGVVIMAGLALGGRVGFVTAGASIAFLVAIGRWPRTEVAMAMDTPVAIVAQSTMLIVVAALAHLAHARINWAFEAAEQSEREFDARSEALSRERERFRVLSESSEDLITEIDLDGNLRYASPNHAEVLGWAADELVDRDWRKLIHPEDLNYSDIRTEIQSRIGEIPATVYRVRHRDGSTRWLESAGRAFTAVDGTSRVVSVTRDVTRRVALETQLRQSQKLEAVGRLAGGVAHDFNNLLTVIDGYSEMLLDDERFRDEPSLREIHAAGERAQSLTRQLLAFSRRQALMPRVLEVGDVLRDVEGLLLRLLGEHITLSFRSNAEPLSVFIDPTELEQVVVNLAVNARDAMPEGGRIEISARTEERRPKPSSAVKESWAVIEVRDEGVGMDAEVLSHLFEPFFTTKEVDEGTGLGLAMVHGIVEQSGGRVEVESEPGVGTCFRIYLPRIEASEAEEVAAPVRVQEPPHPATILLAEDDPAVRRLVQSILSDVGYRVIEASTGLEALSILQQGDDHVDLLLTDVVMPEMGGRALHLKLTEIRPGIPTIFMSGYPNRKRTGTVYDPLPGETLIGKPFTRSELLSTIHSKLSDEALNASPS
jgi:PAS domain S-box-containing protein